MATNKKTLQQLRVEDGLTKKGAAESLGISHDTLKRWEAGETYPNALDILNICELYRTSFDKIEFVIPKP